MNKRTFPLVAGLMLLVLVLTACGAGKPPNPNEVGGGFAVVPIQPPAPTETPTRPIPTPVLPLICSTEELVPDGWSREVYPLDKAGGRVWVQIIYGQIYLNFTDKGSDHFDERWGSVKIPTIGQTETITMTLGGEYLQAIVTNCGESGFAVEATWTPGFRVPELSGSAPQ